MRKWLWIIMVCFSQTLVWGQEELERVVERLDSLYRARSSWTEMEMRVETPYSLRTLRMQAWTEGMNKTLIRISAPLKEKNTATLRIENEMWNYLPKVNTVIKIPPSMMMSSWMGSDFTNDDLVKESTMKEDYAYAWATGGDFAPNERGIEFKPKEGKAIVWGKIVAAIDAESGLPLWHKYYDEKGTLVRVLTFKDVGMLGDRKIPRVMELVPQKKKSYRTVITYHGGRFNFNLPKDTFSQRQLRAVE